MGRTLRRRAGIDHDLKHPLVVGPADHAAFDDQFPVHFVVGGLERVHGSQRHANLAAALERQPLNLEIVAHEAPPLKNPPGLGPRVGPLAVGGLFVAGQPDLERLHGQPAGLRQETHRTACPAPGMGGDLDPRRAHARHAEDLPRQVHRQPDARRPERASTSDVSIQSGSPRAKLPTAITTNAATIAFHEQAGRRRGEQRPAAVVAIGSR